jgi:hypothetical protein
MKALMVARAPSVCPYNFVFLSIIDPTSVRTLFVIHCPTSIILTSV